MCVAFFHLKSLCVHLASAESGNIANCRRKQAAAHLPPPSSCRSLQAWESAWFVRLLRHSPAWLLNLIADFCALLFFNRFVLW